mgnify:CR=1 FL=1
MSLLLTTVLIIGAMFAIKLTLDWVFNKINTWLFNKEAEGGLIADIDSMMKNVPEKSIAVLRKAKEKGYTHLMAKIGDDGRIKGAVDLIEDKSSTPDPELAEVLGEEGMAVIKA